MTESRNKNRTNAQGDQGSPYLIGGKTMGRKTRYENYAKGMKKMQKKEPVKAVNEQKTEIKTIGGKQSVIGKLNAYKSKKGAN